MFCKYNKITLTYDYDADFFLRQRDNKSTRQQVCVSVSESLINKIDCHIETIVLTNMHKQYYLCIVNE